MQNIAHLSQKPTLRAANPPPAAGPGAAPLHPSTLSSHVQRATFNLQPLAPRASYTSRSVRWKRERNSTP
jgi:hypothetical protein